MEDTLGKILNRIIEKQFSQEQMMLLLVKEKLKEYGIELTKHQEKKLILQLQEDGLEEFTFEPTRYQKALLKKLSGENLVLDFQQPDLDALQNKITDAITHAGIETTKWLSDKLFREWKRQSKSILKGIRSERRKFIALHDKIWGKPIDLLDALMSLSLELGNECSQNFDTFSENESDIVFHTLKRLHARGCQVSSEILTLLRGGFADGAHARWRTLHEISVVAQFLANHEDTVTERYLAHSAIVDYQRAIQYRKHSNDLSYAPMSDDEFAQIKTNYEIVKDKYGKEFKNTDWFRNDYWWASAVLNNPHPSFVSIEENIGASFMQPFVKLAHVNVHAGSKGIFFRLGSPLSEEDLLVAGPSVFGVGEPGQNTAYTINNLTTTLLLYKNKDLDNVGSVLALRKFMDEVVWEFDRILEEQEKSNNSPTTP
jgi:hypothetical protein